MIIASYTSNRLPASTPISAITQPKSNPKAPSTLPTNQTDSEPSSDPQSYKLKGSPQLNRWSRARSIRSGRKLDRPLQRTQSWEMMHSPVRTSERESSFVSPPTDGQEVAEEKVGKSIYMVSDGTGWTAEHAVTAALGQFDYCLVDRGCPVNTHLFSGVCSSFHSI